MNKKIFLGYEEIEHEVREVWQIITSSGQICTNKPQSSKYKFVKHIKLKNENNIITAQWQSWQGNSLPFEPTILKLSGDVEEQIVEIDETGIELVGTGLTITVESINEKVVNDVIEVVL